VVGKLFSLVAGLAAGVTAGAIHYLLKKHAKNSQLRAEASQVGFNI
jgi:hypothetical protein